MWALILFFHVGIMGDGNSNATTTVKGFTSEETCKVAGVKAQSMVRGSVKQAEFVCVKVN